MNRLYSLLIANALALSPLVAAYAATSFVPVADNDSAAPLSLTSAKKIVGKILVDNGERTLHPGAANFDRDGNVDVTVVTTQGIAVRHVIVNAKTGGVAYAGTHIPLAKS